MKYPLFLIAFILSFGLTAQETLTLEDALTLALENNYAIKIARKNQEINTNNDDLGNAGFMPSLILDARKNWSSESVNQVFLNGNTNERDGAASENFNATATLQWTLFDGVGMFYTLDRLGMEKEVGAINTKIAVENSIAQLLNAYYTIVLVKERLEVLNNSILLSERRKEIAKNKYEVGKASKLEYLAAQVDYNTDKTLVLQEEESLNNAKIDLNLLLGRAPSIQFEVFDEIDFSRNLRLDELMSTATIKNPNLLLAQRNKNIAYLQSQEIRAERFPQIDFLTNYTYNTSSSEAGFLASNQRNGYTYGFAATMNIFNGGNTNRRAQNAKINMQATELQIDQLTLEIESNISKVYTSYLNNLNLIDIEEENLEVAKENEEIALERYRLGNTTALELREAQVNLVEAESRLLDARYRTKLSEIELLRLSGNLLNPSTNN